MIRALHAAVLVWAIILAAYAIGSFQQYGDAHADTPAAVPVRPVTVMGQTIRPYDPLP